MIVRTAIVGSGYYEGALTRVGALKSGERVLLQREPTNPHDKNAVAVFSEDGVKLGHVPRTEAPTVAKAIDEWREPWGEVVYNGRSSLLVKWEG